MSVQTIIICSTILIALILILLIVYILIRYRRGTNIFNSYSIVDRIKDMGDLVALSSFYKEIATAETGGVPILLTDKRVALISEFEIEWRYDLRRVAVDKSNGVTTVIMPVPQPKVSTGEITLHSKEDGKFMGLIPVNTFSKDDWNKLVKKARESATAIAREQMKAGLLSRIEKAAKQVMIFLFESAGITELKIAFEPVHEIEKDLGDSIEQIIKNRKVA